MVLPHHAGVVVAGLGYVTGVEAGTLPGIDLVAYAGLDLTSVVAVAVLIDIGPVAHAADAVALGLDGGVQIGRAHV